MLIGYMADIANCKIGKETKYLEITGADERI